MVSAKSEKQKAVIDLYNEGKTVRQIAQIVHMSFGDICSLIRRETGEDEEQNRIRMSKSSQALKLFEQEFTPVQVAIELDLETDEIDRLFREYWKLSGLHKLNEIYAELIDNIFSFVKHYQSTKKEGMTPQRVINALKIAEEIPNLEAERQLIEDCIDEDGPKIFELKRQKESILEEVESAREYGNNQLKSIQEELELARKHADNEVNLEQEKLVRQKSSIASTKEFLANEVATAQNHTICELNNSKECLLALRDADTQLKFIQKEVNKLKQEGQELTSRIQRLNHEELEILRLVEEHRRRKHQQEQSIQELQPQLKQQERPNLSEEELKRLAIPVICNNWDRNWKVLMQLGLRMKKA